MSQSERVLKPLLSPRLCDNGCAMTAEWEVYPDHLALCYTCLRREARTFRLRAQQVGAGIVIERLGYAQK